MRSALRFLPVVILAQTVGISAANAAAFELREFSATAMGTAYAGAAANASDPGSLFYNPATLGGVSDFDVSFNGTGLLLNSKGNFSGTTFVGTPTGGNGHPSDFIGSAFLPSVALRYRLNDQWAVGFTATVPFGETTHYPARWAGRYYAQTTNLTDYNFTPMVSYQPTSTLTLSGGLQVDYVHAYLSQAIDLGSIGAALAFPGAVPGGDDGRAALRGNDWQVGYVLGTLWQATPDLSLGVSYRSEMRQNIKGYELFNYDTAGIGSALNGLTGALADSRGNARVPLPEEITGGARYNFGNGWSALAGVEYTGWGDFHKLLASTANPANPSNLTVTNWRSTWFGSLGAEYRPDDRWTFRAGTAYDEAAVPKANVEPRIPDADRYWLALGLGYRWNDHTDINLAYDHLFTPHSTVRQDVVEPGNALRGSLDGVSMTDANLVGLQFVYHE
jgi:long-chain fatty acid transport protein